MPCLISIILYAYLFCLRFVFALDVAFRVSALMTSPRTWHSRICSDEPRARVCTGITDLEELQSGKGIERNQFINNRFIYLYNI